MIGSHRSIIVEAAQVAKPPTLRICPGKLGLGWVARRCEAGSARSPSATSRLRARVASATNATTLWRPPHGQARTSSANTLRNSEGAVATSCACGSTVRECDGAEDAPCMCSRCAVSFSTASGTSSPPISLVDGRFSSPQRQGIRCNPGSAPKCARHDELPWYVVDVQSWGLSCSGHCAVCLFRCRCRCRLLGVGLVCEEPR